MTAGRSPAPTPAAGAGGGLVDDLEADGDLVGVDLEEVRPGFPAWAAPTRPHPPPPPPAPPPRYRSARSVQVVRPPGGKAEEGGWGDGGGLTLAGCPAVAG